MYGLGIPAGAAALAVMFGIFSMDTAKMAVVFVLGAGGLYLGVKHADSLVSETSITGDENDDLSIRECKEKVLEFAEEEFPGNQRIAFRWDSDSFGSTKLDKWDELIRYLTIQHGPNNQEMLAFVNATKDDFLGWAQVEYDVHKIDPFSYCDYVQEYRDEQRRATISYAGRRQYPGRQRQQDPLSLKEEHSGGNEGSTGQEQGE